MACAAFSSGSLAHAQTPAVGAKIGNAIELGERTVPLPQGIWTVVSVEGGSSTKNRAIARIYLAELQNGKLWRWLNIKTNTEYSDGKWARNKEICDRKNVHFAYSDSFNNPNEAECWMVNHWGQTLGNSPSQAAIDFFRWSDTLGRPNTSVGTAYFFVKRSDFLQVEYQINPVLAGFPTRPRSVARQSLARRCR